MAVELFQIKDIMKLYVCCLIFAFLSISYAKEGNGSPTITTGTTLDTTTELHTTGIITTANPPDVGPPDVGLWNVTITNGTTCLLFKGGIQIRIPYDQKMEKIVNIPLNATASGSCTNLTLEFFGSWRFSLIFAESADNNVILNSTTLVYSLSNERFPHYDETPESAAVTASASGLEKWRAEKGNSYMCNNQTSISLSYNVTVYTIMVQVQAVQVSPDGFGPAQQCGQDSSVNYLVPIIVGVVLAVIVVIILISYLIGRARIDKKRGYETV